jgi:hypothetical protein
MTLKYTAYIFHSPHTYEYVHFAPLGSGNYDGTGYIYNGQIVIYVGDDEWAGGGGGKRAVIKWFDLRDNKWKLTNGCEGYDWNNASETKKFRILKNFNDWCDGRLINIVRMNDVIYGSNWYCPYSHGSHYSLRSNTYHRVAEGSSKTLYASKKGVAFGSGQGYLMNNKIYDSGSIWIRMYGYYDPDGKWHETFNEYVYENIAQSPSNYSINTF